MINEQHLLVAGQQPCYVVDSYRLQIPILNPAIQTDEGSVILLDASRQQPDYYPTLGCTSSFQTFQFDVHLSL
jgi:hypothetical protein